MEFCAFSIAIPIEISSLNQVTGHLMTREYQNNSFDFSRNKLDSAYLSSEEGCVGFLLTGFDINAAAQKRIQERARRIVSAVRRKQLVKGGIEAFLNEYDLSSEEGVVLMCLAEALLRIPDTETADRLIRDKIANAQWQEHLGQSNSLFVNAATWGLMLTGQLIKIPDDINRAESIIKSLVARSGEPLIRSAVMQSMRIIAHQFVLGETIEQAKTRGEDLYSSNQFYSFDMLGEAALTREDAARYFQAYSDAIGYLGKVTETGNRDAFSTHDISVKLSALHPRYEFRQRSRINSELAPRLRKLVLLARDAGVGLTIDAEEADRLNLSLKLFSDVYKDQSLGDWEGFGLAVQAYQKRALAVIEWLIQLAKEQGRRIPIRLVKGAYWDSEIKHAQELGLKEYPVFTRKASTDLSYLVCAQRIFAAKECFYPQFATHNAHTIAAILELGQGDSSYEFQRLHGMGEAVYAAAIECESIRSPCRIYAPVGQHKDLLPYLVRRLLENGANSSFINRIQDEDVPVKSITADPSVLLAGYDCLRHPSIPLPRDLYGLKRENSAGINLDDQGVLQSLKADLDVVLSSHYQAAPLVSGKTQDAASFPVVNPADSRIIVGNIVCSTKKIVELAMATAHAAKDTWARTLPVKRAEILNRAAEQFEQNRNELVALCVAEGGRTIPDALSEVREAVDFCRYYAFQLENDFGLPQVLPGPSGEENRLLHYGRGVFACISPWNFPIAIYTGQISAALAAGNTVVAKPASQTPLVAMRIIELFHRSGVPLEVLQFIPGKGGELGPLLLNDKRLAGVAFTGSTDTARQINMTLAGRSGAIVPLIAETGGQNAMIVDSSALLEQATTDILQSAFNSAGQRCSALRVLFIQQDISERLLKMLKGAMEELIVGDPMKIETDIGPVIDDHAVAGLQSHVEYLDSVGQLLYIKQLADGLVKNGSYFAPRMYQIDNLGKLKYEVFGPVLHIIQYSSGYLDNVLNSIRDTGYGLTLGIQSRIDETVRYIQKHLPVGNTYVNRNMIGAVVGVQPFGGDGLSGTGPKAGGPHTLLRYATEHTVTINTAAVGGDKGLLGLDQ